MASQEEAILFAEKMGWHVEVEEPQIRRTDRQKRFAGYGDNFRRDMRACHIQRWQAQLSVMPNISTLAGPCREHMCVCDSPMHGNPHMLVWRLSTCKFHSTQREARRVSRGRPQVGERRQAAGGGGDQDGGPGHGEGQGRGPGTREKGGPGPTEEGCCAEEGEELKLVSQ